MRLTYEYQSKQAQTSSMLVTEPTIDPIKLLDVVLIVGFAVLLSWVFLSSAGLWFGQ